jgi:hypothetical protein
VDPATECDECDNDGIDFVMFDTETNERTVYLCEGCDGKAGPALLVATAHLTPIPVVEYKSIHQYSTPMDNRTEPCVTVWRDEVTYWWHHDGGFRDITSHFPTLPVPGEWWWRVTDLRPLDEPISEYRNEVYAANYSGEPLSDIAARLGITRERAHQLSMKPAVPIDVAPGLSPCPPELARMIEAS